MSNLNYNYCRDYCYPYYNPNLCTPCVGSVNYPIPCNPCNQYTICSPPPCPPPIRVAYITTAPTTTSIPSGTVGVAPTPIPPSSTTIPANTVTVILGYSNSPITNVGGIIVNTSTGQFTVPSGGNYNIICYIGIAANATGTREFYIYRVDATTGIISLIAMDSRNATAVGSTYANLSADVDLNAGDRIFFAVTQNSGSILTTTSDNRFSLVKMY